MACRIREQPAPRGLAAASLVRNDLFPVSDMEALGFRHHVLHGQAGYHGVAVFSKLPLVDAETIAWCGKDDCRHLHLQKTADLEQVLSFLIFADGCAAALVSREPRGLALGDSTTTIAAAAADQITWRIGSQGFDMKLAGSVPGSIGAVLPNQLPVMLQGRPADQVAHWAVHPGGRSVLDAVERALQLGPEALADSRAMLRRYGNMSSASVLFVLKSMLAEGIRGPGCAMAFGPGLTIESLLFEAPE